MKLRPSRVNMLCLSPRPLPNIRRADYRRRKACEVVIIWGAVGLLVWYLLSH
jgi:hypothetical protein